MKNIRLTLAALSLLIGAAAPAILATESVAADAPTTCIVRQANHFTVNSDQTITASFTVEPIVGQTSCTTAPVSLMTWNADSTLYPTDAFYTTQTVNDVETQSFPAGVYTLTAQLPVCSTDPNVVHSYQADIIANADPSHTLSNQPGTFYDTTKQVDGSQIVIDAVVAPGTCPAPTPVPVPTPVPTPAPVTPAAVITPAAKPATLVNTGPGDVAALFVIATLGGMFLYRKLAQRA